ncbi:MAG: DUF1080 domain-containing protein [Pirellulales bacterium]|nr:DUF1080 domain-containing protein [Pirellulales bacterium]
MGQSACLASSPTDEAAILTPKPPERPRINGARVFGVRPGHPFLFTIPATGRRPMTFAVDNLPEGLKVDPQSGQITGTIAEPGEYVVALRSRNALGEDLRKFKIVCGDTLALTPHMGWNSWYVWEGRVSDKIMREAADAMVANGMINHGYQYVNIDACWQVKRGSDDPILGGPARDDQGNLKSNKKFPDMKALADYIHGKGLKAGLYTSPGPTTCGGNYEGAYQHEEQDARQFAEWGFDFLKYDWCSYGNAVQVWGDIENPDLEKLQKPYRQMGDILKKQDRDIVFNLCQYGWGGVWKWGREVGGHSWRTAGDLGGSFDGIPAAMFRDVFNLFGRNELQKFSGPGGWNDPDYLLLGHLSNWKGGSAPTPFTPNEQYTHVSLWCLLSAPLILSGDIARLDDFTLGLLCNDEVIEVDQDPLGKAALRVAKQGDLEVWAKDMEDGSKAVGLFNRGEGIQNVTAKWSDLGLEGKQIVRDLWRQKDLGAFENEFSAAVPRHGVVLVRIRAADESVDDTGFKPIFNGKDLTGWEDKEGLWSVEDGAVTGETSAEKPLGYPLYIYYRGGRPDDFILRLSYRFLSPTGNSGINFRSAEQPGKDILGYQADMETGPNYTGIFYECSGRGIMALRGQKLEIDENGRRIVAKFADPAEMQKHIKAGDWNDYEVIARGPEMIFKINGVKTVHVIDRERGKSASKGLIALQLHPGPPMKVQFKNIRVKSIDAPSRGESDQSGE